MVKCAAVNKLGQTTLRSIASEGQQLRRDSNMVVLVKTWILRNPGMNWKKWHDEARDSGQEKKEIV